ncbi:hypothetical protein GGI10_002064 [Coemansia sp. RSA 2530]|nr:hypothetical protein GGI10_002064 [Coemansia sp. RSA 2530]
MSSSNNSRRSEMAMRAALFNPNVTTTEIRTTLQSANTHHRTTASQPSNTYAAATPTDYFPPPPLSPLQQQRQTPQLTSIPEIAPPDAGDSAGRQSSGKMRSGGNLFRGLKRVAKAVKSAASNTTDGLAVDDRSGGQQALSPRQRSMTQQTHGLSPMARVYSEHQHAHSRSIDLPRGMGQQSDDSSGSQDYAMAGTSRLRRGNTTAAALRSPALSQSSIHSAYAGPMSYEAPASAGAVPLESALLTARSADAVYGAAGPPPSRPAFAMYPQQRDRSMTLPSNGGLAGPALPPRNSSIAVSQPVSPQTPGKISLDISGSPLFKPAVAAREQATVEGRSSGESILKQAERNISVDAESKATAEALVLPPPAVDHGHDSEDRMANTPLSRILREGEAHEATESGSELSDATAEAQPISTTLMPENDSGVLMDNGRQSKELVSGGAISPSVQSRTTSQTSLPIRHQSRMLLESPTSPFSFEHSRYSLINQDGSLNLISFEFDQLDGYQKRLSNSAGSIHSSNGGEGAKGPERVGRKQNTESGWFWGSLASSSDAHGHSVSPSARLSRMSFGPAMAEASDSGNRHSKLMRKGRGSGKQETSGSGDLGLLLQGSGGRTGGHERNHSTSTTHSVLSAATSIPRNSESSGGRNSSSGASRHAILQQQSYSHMSTPLTLLYRQASENNPVVDNRLLRPTPGVNPFDQVYHSSIASMSLEQALTLIEGTTVGDSQSAAGSSSKHRRMHKRSASVLNENELDEIMIQTAEMCHSIQSAIKLQRASESGLGRWINGALGCVADSAPPADSMVKEEECAYDSSSSIGDRGDAAEPAPHCSTGEFVSADTSPVVAQEEQECPQRVPSSSQASSVGLWTAGPGTHSASNILDRVREHKVPESVATSQDSIDISDPVAVPVAVVTPRRGTH